MGFMSFAAIGFVTLRYGNRVHQWDVPLQDVHYWAKVNRLEVSNEYQLAEGEQLDNIEQILYGPIMFLAKLSILLTHICTEPYRKTVLYRPVHNMAQPAFLFRRYDYGDI